MLPNTLTFRKSRFLLALVTIKIITAKSLVISTIQKSVSGLISPLTYTLRAVKKIREKMETKYSNKTMSMNLIQKTHPLLTIWLHFILLATTLPWQMHFDVALSPWPSSRIVPLQPLRPLFISLPSHLYASALTRQLKCSRSQISAKLWWNISIIWRTGHHILYLGPEAIIQHYRSTTFRYGTGSVLSKCNTITVFPMPCRRYVPSLPRHPALTACTMQS